MKPSSVIVGIGNDSCDVRRIQAVWERHGDRFVQRVLGPNEQRVWQQRSERWSGRGVRYLATRFSAKEAFSKAVGLGMRMPMTWRDCEILNHPSGQPYVRLSGALKTWFEGQGWCAHVTVSDESDYATSVVIVERPPSLV
jgi:holo-[acyl-carrier protein] synthase